MWTGDAYRPFWHDLHFNAAWSFQIAVVRARDRTSANRIQGGLSAKPVDGDLTQPTLSAPKWAAAIAAPVAESSPHSSNKSITYMKFRLEFGTRKPGLHVLCAQAGSSKWNFFHGWRVLQSCGPAPAAILPLPPWLGPFIEAYGQNSSGAEVIINDRSAISPSGHERRAAHPRRISGAPTAQ